MSFNNNWDVYFNWSIYSGLRWWDCLVFAIKNIGNKKNLAFTIKLTLCFLLLGCKQSHTQVIKMDPDFLANYTKVYCVQPKLDDYDDKFVKDSLTDLSEIFWKIEMTRSEIDTLVSILTCKDCFESLGDCTTYFDQQCYIFMKEDTVLRVICAGCSYTAINYAPEDWPCKSMISDKCDSLRWNPFLEKIWKRIPPE